MGQFTDREEQRPIERKLAISIAVAQVWSADDPEVEAVAVLLLPPDSEVWLLGEMTPAEARMTAARILNAADEVEARHAQHP